MKKVEKTTRPFRYDLQSNPLQLYSRSDKQIYGIKSHKQRDTQRFTSERRGNMIEKYI